VILLVALAIAAPRDEFADLVAKLRSASDQGARYTAANALAKIAKPAQIPLVMKELDAGPAAIRPHLVHVLASMTAKEAIVALRVAAQRHELACRAEAAYALAAAEDPGGLQKLLELLPRAESDEDKRIVLSHLWGLPSEGGEVSTALSAFLDREKKEELRKLAIRALAYQKDPGALPALRKIAANADDPGRPEAIAELVRRGDADALDQAFALLEGVKGGFANLYTLLNAIERANSKAALPRLRKLLEETPDQALRAELIRTLADLKDDKSLAAIAKLTGDPDPNVARAATEAVVKLSGKGQLDLLRKAAGEGEGTARLEAAVALLNLDRPEGFEALKAELESTNLSHRQQAVTALARVRRKESVDLLLPLIDGKDYVANQARSGVFATLETLFPYRRFDRNAAPDKIRAWWTQHRPP
jgi:HEAT repeat protein